MTPEPVTRPHPQHVVLDIGDELGALIVYADAQAVDAQIEISPADADDRRAHQHILERPMSGRTSYAAVFDKIAVGTYTLWTQNEPRARDVLISGGEITELDWTGQGSLGASAPARAT